MNKIDQLSINTIRVLSAEGVEKAKSGHPGMPMGAAPWPIPCGQGYEAQPGKPGMGRQGSLYFVRRSWFHAYLLLLHCWLRSEHGGIDEFQTMGQQNSRSSGIRAYCRGGSYHRSPGTGNFKSVGMAMAEAHLAAKFNRPGMK